MMNQFLFTSNVSFLTFYTVLHNTTPLTKQTSKTKLVVLYTIMRMSKFLIYVIKFSAKIFLVIHNIQLRIKYMYKTILYLI